MCDSSSPNLKAKNEEKYLNTANLIYFGYDQDVLTEPCFGFAFYQRRGKIMTSTEAHTEHGEANKD